MQIHITKASPIGSRSVDSVIINISGSPPEHKSLEEAAEWYDSQARVLLDALCHSLPGGTLHHLLAGLLERRASLLRVPMFQQQEE